MTEDPRPTQGDVPAGSGATGDRPTRDTLGARARRFEQTVASRVATRVVQLPFGVARLAPDIAEVYSLSDVEITRPAAVSEILTAIEPVFVEAGLAHRRLSTHLPEMAWTLAPALADRGWEIERLVVMVHDGITVPPVSGLGFSVVDIDRWLGPARRFVADNDWGTEASVQDAMGDKDRRLAERIGARFVLADDGSAGCHLYRQGQTAQIEMVHVLSEHRGRGLGHGLMATAMAECADAGMVFLVAEASDWPRHWYRRLGFEPMAASWGWVRRPHPGPAADPSPIRS